VARGPQYGPSPKDRLPGRDRPGRGGRINPGLSDVRPTRRSVVTRSLVLRRSAARRLTVARPSAPFRSWLQRALAPTRLSRSLPPPLANGDHVVDNCRRGDRQISSDGSFPSPWPLARRMTRHGEP